MTNKTMMRVDKDLLKEIASCKIIPAESYQNVVKRLIDEKRDRGKLLEWKATHRRLKR